MSANLAAGGGVLTAIPIAVVTLGTIVVFLLSLRIRSEEAPISPAIPALVVIGIIAWIILANPLLAALAAVIADALAGIPTLRKTWSEPTSEPAVLWTMGAIGCVCAVGALVHFNLTTMLYPVYLFSFETAMALLAFRSLRATTHKA